MQFRFVIRNTDKVVYNSDSGLNQLETEQVLQVRETDDDEWEDVPVIDLS